jgi:Flp pilus assembly protein TadD
MRPQIHVPVRNNEDLMPATPYPGADSDAYSQTLELLNSGETEAAATLCRQLCESEPENAAAHRLMGVIAFQLGELEGAAGLLRRAVELDGALPGGQRDLAEVLAAKGDSEAAMRALDQAIEQDPGDAFAYRQRALLLHGADRFAEAEDACAQALSIAPGLTVAQSTMGLIKAQRGDVPRAAEYLMQARKSPKPPSDPGNLLIRCLAALGQSAEISALQPPATIAERHGEAVLLALFAWQTNQGEACRQLLEQARPLVALAAEAGEEAPPRQDLAETLERLLDWQAAHPEAYAGTVDQPLFHLGDQHCLPSAHLVAEIAGRRWLTICETIPGLKAWHLAKPRENFPRAAFQAAVQRLPEDAALLVSCGAVDCGLNTGIPAYVRANSDRDPMELVDALVPAFVDRVVELTAPRGTKVIFQTPRASNAPEALVPHKDLILMKGVMQRFCQRLRETTKARDLRLLDLNEATSDAQGRSKGHLYYDTDHLRPQAYLDAFAAGLR